MVQNSVVFVDSSATVEIRTTIISTYSLVCISH